MPGARHLFFRELLRADDKLLPPDRLTSARADDGADLGMVQPASASVTNGLVRRSTPMVEPGP